MYVCSRPYFLAQRMATAQSGQRSSKEKICSISLKNSSPGVCTYVYVIVSSDVLGEVVCISTSIPATERSLPSVYDFGVISLMMFSERQLL